MATKVKRVDMSSLPFGRSVSWTSASDFANTDVLDIQNSLLKASTYLLVEVAAASSCTFRVNSVSTRYPLHEESAAHGVSAPDLQNGATCTDPNALTYSLGAGEVLELTDLPVANLEFTALVGTVVVTAR